jgi:hypothetical protein
MSYKSGTSAPVVLVLFSSLVNASQGSTLCLRFCDPEACMRGSCSVNLLLGVINSHIN